ncbi:hypothetical protein BJ508DRAFT_418071 [Ascobolus immersus RN42]|uniref:Uncharacterized protein n=1 Tax=Ascobolus immersus RN42 TaxID=1160509 RepID=A0A3N4I0T7_ASCIM|nr:hypothetical protein BJ508DRAFT_418071 [Ascobolus immersus RN42]
MSPNQLLLLYLLLLLASMSSASNIEEPPSCPQPADYSQSFTPARILFLLQKTIINHPSQCLLIIYPALLKLSLHLFGFSHKGVVAGSNAARFMRSLGVVNPLGGFGWLFAKLQRLGVKYTWAEAARLTVLAMGLASINVMQDWIGSSTLWILTLGGMLGIPYFLTRI